MSTVQRYKDYSNKILDLKTKLADTTLQALEIYNRMIQEGTTSLSEETTTLDPVTGNPIKKTKTLALKDLELLKMIECVHKAVDVTDLQMSKDDAKQLKKIQSLEDLEQMDDEMLMRLANLEDVVDE